MATEGLRHGVYWGERKRSQGCLQEATLSGHEKEADGRRATWMVCVPQQLHTSLPVRASRAAFQNCKLTGSTSNQRSPMTLVPPARRHTPGPWAGVVLWPASLEASLSQDSPGGLRDKSCRHMNQKRATCWQTTECRRRQLWERARIRLEIP